jgi:predicted transcriptional regulator
MSMSTLNERLQILVSSDQRRRLEAEARRRGTSVGSLVRQAIDAQFGAVTREDRLAAVEAIRSLRGRYLTPEEINRLVEEERESAFKPRS